MKGDRQGHNVLPDLEAGKQVGEVNLPAEGTIDERGDVQIVVGNIIAADGQYNMANPHQGNDTESDGHDTQPQRQVGATKPRIERDGFRGCRFSI